MFEELRGKLSEMKGVIDLCEAFIDVMMPGYSDDVVEMFRDECWKKMQGIKEAYDNLEKELMEGTKEALL